MSRHLPRILRIALIPLLLVALAYGCQQLGFLALDILAGYPGVALGQLPPGPAPDAVARRAVVVVVDALREDTSRQMPTFQALRERGADLPSWAGLPSLSLPGYAVLGTGAYPDVSGVTTNWYEGAVRVDSLLARAKEAGLSTGVVAMGGWDMLYGPWATYVYTGSWSAQGHDYRGIAETTEAIGQEALRLLRETDVRLLYVHFGETDEAGHGYGGDSPEYLEAALHVDAQIAAIAGALDWSQDLLVLTADHGMSDNQGRVSKIGGGHGGGETVARRVPLVLVGRGIVPGTYPDGQQADLVPTAAALLGLPIPAQSQGRTRLDVLVLTAEQRAAAALSLGAQQQGLYDAYLRVLGARPEPGTLAAARAALEAGDISHVPGLVEQELARLDLAFGRAAANRLWMERLLRLPYLLVPLLAAVLAVALFRRRRELLGPLLLAALFLALYWLLYAAVRGHTISFTTIGGLDETIFFLSRTLDAAIVMGIVALVAGVVWRRRPWHEVVWRANLTALTIAWAMLLQMGLFLWLYGLPIVWRLPDLGWGFKFYLDVLAAVGVGYAGLLFPWLALGMAALVLLGGRLVARLARRSRSD